MIYKLGNHRLLCGDGTDAFNIRRLMNGEYAELMFTDPPYSMETTGGKTSAIGQRLNRKGAEIEYMAHFKPIDFFNVLPEFFRRNQMNAYIFSNKALLPDYLNFAVKQKYAFNVLVWKKPNPIPLNGSHWPDIEYIIHFRKNAVWNQAVPETSYSKCLEYARIRKSEELGNHPTVKPVPLILNEIKISSKMGGIVADPFGGTGSTMMAAEMAGRRCYMAEISPFYCGIIIKRWEKLTGRKAEYEH